MFKALLALLVLLISLSIVLQLAFLGEARTMWMVNGVFVIICVVAYAYYRGLKKAKMQEKEKANGSL